MVTFLEITETYLVKDIFPRSTPTRSENLTNIVLGLSAAQCS